MSAAREASDALGVVLAVFVERPDGLGKPDAPTKAGFLALARAGREVWNLWRDTWPEPKADFGEVDFRETEIDFSGFVFGQAATFAGAQFGDAAYFAFARFANGANFIGAQFGDGASFANAQFGHGVGFNGAQFGEVATFAGAQFGDFASFEGGQFGFGVGFPFAKFGDRATFAGARFGDQADFTCAQFGDLADFSAWSLEQVEDDWRLLGLGAVAAGARIRHAGLRGLRSDAFHGISFSGVQFSGFVNGVRQI